MEHLNIKFDKQDFNPSFIQKLAKGADISQEVALKVLEYAKSNQEEWNKRLNKGHGDSILLRHKETGLPLTIEYLKTGELLVHTKKRVGNGGNKKVFVSVDLVNERLLARVKGYSREKNIKEAKTTDLLAGQGIVKKYHESHYNSKTKLDNSFHAKHAMYLELYDGTLDQLATRKLSLEEIKAMSIDLSEGLAKIHDRGELHEDFKPANIFFKVDPETNKVTHLVLGDYGELIDGSILKGDLKQQGEVNEVNRLIGSVISLFKTQKIDVPDFLYTLSMQNHLFSLRKNGPETYVELLEKYKDSKKNIPPHDQPVSAREVVNVLKQYFKPQ